MTKIETHLKLQLREIIDNWRYIDTILFMMILVIYVGFTDPCDRCLVNTGYGEQTCKEAFLNKIGFEEIGSGFVIPKQDNFNFPNITINLTPS
jgi:hypothetical protein